MLFNGGFVRVELIAVSVGPGSLPAVRLVFSVVPVSLSIFDPYIRILSLYVRFTLEVCNHRFPELAYPFGPSGGAIIVEDRPFNRS